MLKKLLILLSGIILSFMTVYADDMEVQNNKELTTFVVDMTGDTCLLADVEIPTTHYYMSDDLVKTKIEVGDILTGYGKLSPQEDYPPYVISYDFQVLSGQKVSDEEMAIAKESAPGGMLLSELMEKWGSILYEYSDRIPDENDDIKYIDEDELNRTIEFYKLRGDENPEELALTYVAENQALYIEAIDKGLEVTDLEILLYLDEIKSQLENANNGQEYKRMIEQFPSEEAYWTYQFEISKKSILVDAYLEQRGKELVTNNILDIYSPDFQDKWAEELKIIKDELVEKHFPGNLMDYVK